jgi:hypothetical protein
VREIKVRKKNQRLSGDEGEGDAKAPGGPCPQVVENMGRGIYQKVKRQSLARRTRRKKQKRNYRGRSELDTMRDQMGCRWPTSQGEQFGGNLRSILWQADVAAQEASPWATQGAARRVPEVITVADARAGRPTDALVLFDKLLRMRG